MSVRPASAATSVKGAPPAASSARAATADRKTIEAPGACPDSDRRGADTRVCRVETRLDARRQASRRISTRQAEARATEIAQLTMRSLVTRPHRIWRPFPQRIDTLFLLVALPRFVRPIHFVFLL